jgi:uncharacterized protein (DUF849 family)
VDPKMFEEVLEKVRAKCDIITQIPTGARGGKTMEERGAPSPKTYIRIAIGKLNKTILIAPKNRINTQ